MFKNMVVVAFLSLSLLQVSCSSNKTGDDDLDISEIKKIESTGEFSEDEFFSDEELVAEGDDAGKLIEVPGDEVAAEGGSADLEDVGGELDLEILEDGEADLLADADLDVANEFADEDIKIEGDLAEDNGDLNIDELGFDEETSGGDSTEVATGGEDQLLLEEDGTDFNDFDDFSSDTAAVDPGPSDDSSNVTISTDEMDDLIAGDIDTEEPTATDLLQNENVTIEGDVATDTAFENEPSVDVVNDFSDFDEPVADNSATALLEGEDISVDSSYEDVDAGTSFDSSEPSVEEVALEQPKKTYTPVKKMKTVPFVKNGILANSIYFVRSGDSLGKIANKIYGSGSAVDFTIVNSYLKPGALRVGQKVYYNSPRRPQDRSRLITFYEDMGTPAQYYQAQEGQNIRKISKDLLGHSRSWMEVWASNQDIVSKGALDSNYSVKYWMGGEIAQPAVLASNEPIEETRIEPQPVAEQPRSNDNRNSLEAEIEMDQKIEEQQAANNNDQLEDFDEPAQVDEPNFDEPVVNNNINNNNGSSAVAGGIQNNEPTSIDEPDFSNDDLADNGSAAGIDNGFDDMNNGATDSMQDDLANNPETPRDIAKRPSFPMSKRTGALSKSMIESLALGFGALLLLLAVVLIVRKKRKRAEAIQMDSFDFGGETTIETEQTKTQIDI